MKRVLVTGSSGLVGSESVIRFHKEGYKVIGIDNDMRGKMFGDQGSTGKIGEALKQLPNFFSYDVDIRNIKEVQEVFKAVGPFDVIIHAAAQPAHEYSTNHALEDFSINAFGTMNILEAYRQYSPEAIFIHVSSSKVYGDSVNELPLEEYETRFDLPKKHKYYEGVDETMRLDGNLHSLFGASKACADIMAKEYGTYFNLPISIFRPVCISGSVHRGVALHGYLAYLVKCVATGTKYTINGYKGKQVRDNIHARDLVSAFMEVVKKPPKPGTAYNIGGGRESNNSILEALEQAGKILKKKPVYDYSEINRRGDHKWCIYSSKKFRKDYPSWKIEYTNDKLMEELCRPYIENGKKDKPTTK